MDVDMENVEKKIILKSLNKDKNYIIPNNKVYLLYGKNNEEFVKPSCKIIKHDEEFSLLKYCINFLEIYKTEHINLLFEDGYYLDNVKWKLYSIEENKTIIMIIDKDFYNTNNFSFLYFDNINEALNHKLGKMFMLNKDLILINEINNETITIKYYKIYGSDKYYKYN